MKYTITLNLSPKQAQALASHAGTVASVASDRVLAGAVDKLLTALREAEEDAKANAPDVHACSLCTSVVTHSKRGRRLPVRHKCPHGKDCSRAWSDIAHPRCRACVETRRARTAPPYEGT